MRVFSFASLVASFLKSYFPREMIRERAGLVSQGSGGKRSLHQRYVNTFSNSTPTDNRNASQTTPSAAAFLPPFSNVLLKDGLYRLGFSSERLFFP